MAILSTLLSMSEPSGMWVSIIRAFEGFTNNYVLAVILLTVIIRIIWAPIDTLNRRMSFKMSEQQAKMKPELDRINKKYANDPKMLKQKQNELYQKSNSKSMGSCGFMFLFLALNLVVFFTLFSGLNAMASYKIYSSYEELKFDYANSLVLTNEYTNSLTENLDTFEDYENLYFKRFTEGEGESAKEYIGLFKKESNEELARREFSKDFSSKRTTVNEQGEEVEVVDSTNTNLTKILKLFYPENLETDGKIVATKVVTNENGEEVTENVYFGEAFKVPAISFVEEKYKETKDSFLWIGNIWIADSPFENSVFSFETFKSRVGSASVEEGEELIYNSFMTDIREDAGRVNGYLILPLLCILSSFLSMWLTSRKKKGQEVPAQAGGKFMKFIMPIIFGIFALFYNSVFAIYMFISQIISTLLIPLQNLIISKWNDYTKKKEEEKVEVVDYSRKF